jgi:hypothetical protein
VLVGATFERATVALMGGKRGGTNGTMEVCPDVINDSERLMLESKGGQFQSPFRLGVRQLKAYRDLRLDEARRGFNTQIVYCLWEYREKSLSVGLPVGSDLVRRVVNACERVYVLDINVLLALFELADDDATAPDTCAVRNYSSWKCSDGGDWYCLNVGHRWLRRIANTPCAVLRDLGLALDGYVHSWKRLSGLPFKFDGLPLCIRALDVVRLVRPVHWIEHPRAEQEYLDELSEAPF